jgi:hypothetical protein
MELALCIAIEAERALDEAATAVGLPREELEELLDAEAASCWFSGPQHELLRPLNDYAVALADSTCGPPPDIPGALHARVPYRVAATWIHAAAAAGVPFDSWLSDTAVRAIAERVSWEATAARAGRTLAEWVLLQAARCARLRRTSPQTTALG